MYANPLEKQVCSLFKFHVHHCLFMFPKMLRVKMTFFSLKLCRLTPPSYTHSFPLTKPSVVWVPAYMIVIPIFTEVGLVPQRQSEKGQRCQRAQSHSLSAFLLPFPLSLTLLLGHVLPRHPQNHSPSLPPLLAPPSPPSTARRMAG